MLDFLMVSTRSAKRGVIEIYPKFIINKSTDLMIRGGDFYAIWNEEKGLWSTDEQDALQLIDKELDAYAEKYRNDNDMTRVLHMWDAESGMIDSWHKYCQKQMRDNFRMLDEKLIFANTPTRKNDYASKRLKYPLEKGNIAAYDRLMSTLYSEEERRKIEWAIGAVVSGDSKHIQKFMVLYGAAGTGKSTVLNIIEKLFAGYCSVFDAKALGSSSNSFALEAFKANPLVAIQHDGDLSRIEDNTRINSLVSHELMTVNEKFKSTYSNRFKCFLFIGTNKPVKITDAKSGLIRRLIDVSPTGEKIPSKEYEVIVKQIDFELGAIAYHCQEVYLSNPGLYDSYIPVAMMGASNDFYNFMLDSYFIFKKEDCTTLKTSWEMYKTYCDEAKVSYPYSQRVFKEELKNYFREYKERYSIDNNRVRSYYSGFRYDKFDTEEPEQTEQNDILPLLELKEQPSIFDQVCADCPAQYANDAETPTYKWMNVTTTLNDISTDKLHYVKLPSYHIVIDFDLKDENGEKSYELNLAEASKWPPTYAELSKSGKGIHLHYIYTGDVSLLERVYKEGIEVKVFEGNSSLRRKLTKCNDIPIATLSSGLPLKGESRVINFENLKNEKSIRTLIKNNLNKEYHASTKSSVDFMYKILQDAYESGMHYDVSDMYTPVLAFAASSTNNSQYCIKLVNRMHFKSEDISEGDDGNNSDICFYDVEVFPNLFLVNWKIQGAEQVMRMINPSPQEIEALLNYKLIGFNCRRYDNHILYGRLIGYSNEQIYKLSTRIINGSPNCFFGEAYNISYTDVYDFASKKQSLKKWEIELNIHHKELGLPWNQPVPESRWNEVAEYCDNDVRATEALFNHLKGDWTARQILADLAGMSVNTTTNTLTTRIIFGNERNPDLVYTDLATGEASNPEYQRIDICNAFPGYEYADGKNMYRGDDLGKGGYVYSEPGIYTDVALLDVASLHPHSIVAMNCFGKYTQNFKDILDARILIKHGDYDAARKMFGGKLARYLNDESTAKDLAQALKIAINSVYGLTSASFSNPFRDDRNVNNIVALRGALFMRTLQDEVAKRGFVVAHIKTDSIKIPNATPDIIEFCMDFAKQYGYTFEHEATYDKMCLINDAVYIAKYPEEHKFKLSTGEVLQTKWTATGTQFQIPYVFKKVFSKDPIKFEDLCETKQVSTALYLDMNEGAPDVSDYEAEKAKLIKRYDSDDAQKQEIEKEANDIVLHELDALIAEGHNYIVVGRVGRFCPIKAGCGGGLLMRETVNKKTGEREFAAANSSKGYRWLESEMVQEFGKEDDIDRGYYEALVDDALDVISKFGDVEQFID